MDRSEIAPLRQILGATPPSPTFSAQRARLDEIGSLDPIEPAITVTPVNAGGVAGEWSLAPGADVARVLLYLHGGGYVAGSLRSHRAIVTGIGRAAGVRTLAIAYRLAPEHPFPAAIEDTLAAYRFLLAHDYTAQQIVIAGDGAGAGLVLALCQTLRAEGLPQPACGWLVSPWADLELGAANAATPAQAGSLQKDSLKADPLIDPAALRRAAAAYLADVAHPRHPLAAPLHGDLSGLPPTLIQAGSAEQLLEDAVRLTGRLAQADVRVRLSVYPHMPHAWPLWHARLAEGRRALTEAGAFVSRWIRT